MPLLKLNAKQLLLQRHLQQLGCDLTVIGKVGGIGKGERYAIPGADVERNRYRHDRSASSVAGVQQCGKRNVVDFAIGVDRE